MKSTLKLTSAACLLAMLAVAMPAQSQILWDSLVDNTLNFYADQDRESIFDIDGDGAVTEGDVFVGLVRIDDRVEPLPGISTSPDLYGIFSIQVDSITSTDNGDGTISYDIQYVATDETAGTGLSMYELTGSTNTDLIGMTNALYEDVNANLITGLPGGGGTIDVDGDGQFTILDYLAEVTNDTLDLIAGLEVTTDTGDGIDHYGIDATVSAAADPLADLSLLESATQSGGLPADATISFHAGLGITWSGGGYLEDCAEITPEQCWARLVEDDVENPLNPSLHELTVQNGDVSGASDKIFATTEFGDVNPYFSGTADGAGIWNDYNFYGLTTNADFGLYPELRVPEPSMLALMGVGLFAVGAAARRRRKV